MKRGEALEFVGRNRRGNPPKLVAQQRGAHPGAGKLAAERALEPVCTFWQVEFARLGVLADHDHRRHRFKPRCSPLDGVENCLGRDQAVGLDDHQTDRGTGQPAAAAAAFALGLVEDLQAFVEQSQMEGIVERWRLADDADHGDAGKHRLWRGYRSRGGARRLALAGDVQDHSFGRTHDFKAVVGRCIRVQFGEDRIDLGIGTGRIVMGQRQFADPRLAAHLHRILRGRVSPADFGRIFRRGVLRIVDHQIGTGEPIAVFAILAMNRTFAVGQIVRMRFVVARIDHRRAVAFQLVGQGKRGVVEEPRGDAHVADI